MQKSLYEISVDLIGQVPQGFEFIYLFGMLFMFFVSMVLIYGVFGFIGLLLRYK